MLSRFNISDYEAITFENRSNPIATQRLLFRACGDTDPNTMSPCDRDVEQEALTIATHIRQLTSAVGVGLRRAAEEPARRRRRRSR